MMPSNSLPSFLSHSVTPFPCPCPSFPKNQQYDYSVIQAFNPQEALRKLQDMKQKSSLDTHPTLLNYEKIVKKWIKIDQYGKNVSRQFDQRLEELEEREIEFREAIVNADDMRKFADEAAEYCTYDINIAVEWNYKAFEAEKTAKNSIIAIQFAKDRVKDARVNLDAALQAARISDEQLLTVIHALSTLEIKNHPSIL